MEEKKLFGGRGRSRSKQQALLSSSSNTSEKNVTPNRGRGRQRQISGKQTSVISCTTSDHQKRSVVPCAASNQHDKRITKIGTVGSKISLKTNFFKLVSNPNWILYKFHVDFFPVEDHTKMKKQLMREHRTILGMYLFDGSTIFSINNFCPENKPLELISKRIINNAPVKIIIKLVGTVEPGDYQRLQVFNIIIRECMSKMKLQLIKRHYFDKDAAISIRDYGLELWPGYITAMAQYEQDILLQAEIIYKVLRKDTAYNLLNELLTTNKNKTKDFKEVFCSMIIGNTVMTTYNDKTYRVDDVSFDVTPLNTFLQKTKHGYQNITYSSYYEQKYNVKIIDTKQPLLITKTNARERRAGLPELLYLVPELCVLTGWSDTMRSDYKLMKSVADHTAVNPSDRVQRLEQFSKRLTSIPEVSQKLTDWGLDLSNELLSVEGRILPEEKIYVYNNKTFMSGADWTNQMKKSSLLLSVEMHTWVLIYPKLIKREAGIFVDLIRSSAKGMNFKISFPKLFEISNETFTAYVQGIDDSVNQYNPQMIVCILRYNRTDLYSAIKRKAILDTPVPSQVLLLKNIVARSAFSIATKILMQMNCKVGGAPWRLCIPLPDAMIIGFDVCHDTKNKSKSFGAMVASMDSLYARYFSSIGHHSNGDELSSSFSLHVMKAVKHYEAMNKTLPNPIILYRDGVGDGDLKNVQEIEITSVLEALKMLYKEKPLRFATIIVTKRIHTRLIHAKNKEPLCNPPPGTVVDDVITNPKSFDFFLISQLSRHGTVSPTHYNVLYDSTGLSADHIQLLTYKLTHLYYNWSGTIRVPAPCQYAHKLAYLTSQNIGISHSNLDRLLYYL